MASMCFSKIVYITPGLQDYLIIADESCT